MPVGQICLQSDLAPPLQQRFLRGWSQWGKGSSVLGLCECSQGGQEGTARGHGAQPQAPSNEGFWGLCDWTTLQEAEGCWFIHFHTSIKYFFGV